MFKLALEKAEEPEIKLPTSAGSSKKQESSRKNIYFCFIDYAKAFDCVDHSKLWKILKEMRIPDHLTCLLRNLYADQEQQLELDREQSRLVPNRKRSTSRLYIVTVLILSNLYEEYIMRIAGLVEAQAGIRLPGEISVISDMQMTQRLWQNVKN